MLVPYKLMSYFLTVNFKVFKSEKENLLDYISIILYTDSVATVKFHLNKIL